MDFAALATVAAAAAVKELATATAKGGLAAGQSVWSWIRSRAGNDQNPSLDRIETEPERASSKVAAQGIVMGLLEDRPEMAEELAQLLKSAGHTNIARQEATSGDNAQTAQVVGQANSVNQTR